MQRSLLTPQQVSTFGPTIYICSPHSQIGQLQCLSLCCASPRQAREHQSRLWRCSKGLYCKSQSTRGRPRSNRTGRRTPNTLVFLIQHMHNKMLYGFLAAIHRLLRSDLTYRCENSEPRATRPVQSINRFPDKLSRTLTSF